MQPETGTIISIAAFLVSLVALLRTISNENVSKNLALISVRAEAVLSLLAAQNELNQQQRRLRKNLVRVVDDPVRSGLADVMRNLDEQSKKIDGLVEKLDDFVLEAKPDKELVLKLHSVAADARVLAARAMSSSRHADDLISAL